MNLWGHHVKNAEQPTVGKKDREIDNSEVVIPDWTNHVFWDHTYSLKKILSLFDAVITNKHRMIVREGSLCFMDFSHIQTKDLNN